MDIPNSILTQLKVQSVLKGSGDVLAQLQQAGAFRAIVLQAKGAQVILDTAFGQISSRSNSRLNAGDVILARLDSNNSQNLKIEQFLPRSLSLHSSSLSRVLSQMPQQASLATVVRQQGSQTLLQVGQQQIPINTQKHVQTGDTFLLQARSANQVEMTRVQPLSILKRALAQLLPRQQGQPSDSPVKLNQLLHQLLEPKVIHLKQWQANLTQSPTSQQATAAKNPLPLTAPNGTPLNTTKPDASIAEQPIRQAPSPHASANLDSKPAITRNSGDSLDRLIQLIQQISQFRINGTQVSADTIQNLLKLASLIKPEATASDGLKSLPQQLQVLQTLLKSSPESFNQLVRDWLSNLAVADARQAAVADRSLLDLSAGLRNELLSQLEQSMTQLLVQKTSLRLQIEQQSLLQFHLNIPLQVDDKTTALKLKVKQRDNHHENDQQSWEINLSFEFAQLGLITTNLLLQDRTLSAHFWSVKPETTNLINHHLDDFKQQLVSHGFQLGDFASHPGQPVVSDPDSFDIEDNLVDINV